MILLNSLGGYEYEMHVSAEHKNAFMGKPDRYEISTSTIAKGAPFKKWTVYEKKEIETVVKPEVETFATENGFEIVGVEDIWGYPRWILEHVETRAAKEQAQKEFDAKWADAEEGYIRFGELPENGKSYNYASKNYEEGVSVYKALIKENEYHLKLENAAQLWGGLTIQNERKAYQVIGEVCGTGSDGEPILKNCKIIREMN